MKLRPANSNEKSKCIVTTIPARVVKDLRLSYGDDVDFNLNEKGKWELCVMRRWMKRQA